MRDYFTTGELAREAKKTRQQIWNLWMDRRLPGAELINPGATRLRFKKTRQLQDWCKASAKKADELAVRRRSRKYRFWTQYHEDLLARLVRRKNPNQHSDLVAFRTWKELSIKNRLDLDELNESFRRGIVTRIRRDGGDRSAGVSTWRGLTMQFYLMRRQIGEKWREWLPEQKMQIRDELLPVVEFYNQLGDKRNNLA
jgi:hypothetical protein